MLDSDAPHAVVQHSRNTLHTQANKPKKAAKALLAPTAILTTATSAGKPVMVGGPPTIDLFAAGMKLGLKGLGKMGKKFRNFTRKFTHAVHAYIESLGLNPKLTKILKKTACTVLGEPVDVATGRVYHTNTDFELPGPIPVVWERTYYSDAAVDGPLGYNWHHSYNLGIHPLGDEASCSDMRTEGNPHCPHSARGKATSTVRNS
mgnify:CR=1 FL=1